MCSVEQRVVEQYYATKTPTALTLIEFQQIDSSISFNRLIYLILPILLR